MLGSNQSFALEENQIAESTSLYQGLFVHDGAVDPLITDWIESFEKDQIDAVTDLINFLIESTGCPGKISRQVFDEEQEVTDCLEDLQTKFKLDRDYPIVQKAKGIKFKRNLADFWKKFILSLQGSLLYQDDCWLLDSIKIWVVAMSSSSFRPFRHTCTVVSLSVMGAICDIYSSLNTEYGAIQKQLNKKSDKRNQLNQKLSDISEKKSALEKQMNEIFDSVFVHRYRDSESIIRNECIKELGAWVIKLPQIYLDPQYLRYIGWMLSDKVSNVRLESTKALIKLFKQEHMIQGLRELTERFKQRIFEMALRDKDQSVQLHSIQLIGLIGDAGLLENYDMSLSSLLLHDNEKIRNAASPVLAGWFKEQFEETLENWDVAKCKSNASKIKEYLMFKEFVSFLAGAVPEESEKEESEKNSLVMFFTNQRSFSKTLRLTFEFVECAVDSIQSHLESNSEALLEYLTLEFSEKDPLEPTNEERTILLWVLTALVESSSDNMNISQRLLEKFTVLVADKTNLGVVIALFSKINLGIFKSVQDFTQSTLAANLKSFFLNSNDYELLLQLSEFFGKLDVSVSELLMKQVYDSVIKKTGSAAIMYHRILRLLLLVKNVPNAFILESFDWFDLGNNIMEYVLENASENQMDVNLCLLCQSSLILLSNFVAVQMIENWNEDIKDKLDRVANVAEALLINQRGFALEFRVAAFQTLSDFYLLLNGKFSEKLNGFTLKPDSDVEKAIVEVLVECVEKIGFTCHLNKTANALVKSQMLSLFADFTKLVQSGLIHHKYVPFIAQYYGVDADSCFFGSGVDALTELVACNLTHDVAFDCLEKSIDLYLSGKVDSIDHSVKLAETMKLSESILQDSEIQHRLVEMMLKDSATTIMTWKRNQRQHVNENASNPAEMTFDMDELSMYVAQLPTEKLVNLDELENAVSVCKVWSVFASKLPLIPLETTEEQVEDAEQLLESKGISVGQNRDWAAWNELKSVLIGKKQSRNRQKKPKSTVKKNSSFILDELSPASSIRKSSRNVKRKSYAHLDDDTSEDETPSSPVQIKKIRL